MSTILLPKTQHLVVFQEVIRSGSIGSAAKELGLTQPAVSKISNDIEDYLGLTTERIKRIAYDKIIPKMKKFDNFLKNE